MWKARLPMILLAVVLVIIVYQFATIKPEGAKMVERQPAPEFTLESDKEQPPFTKASLKGKVVILDFWATWCGPCRESIPELAALYTKYKDRGLEIIGISMDDNNTRVGVPAAMKDFGINYPVVYAYDNLDIVKDYPAESIPMMYILDKEGNLRDKITGYRPGMKWNEKIEALLDE